MLYLLVFLAEILLLYFLSKRLKNTLFNFFYKITKSKKLTLYLFAFIFLPGTYFHEFAHGLVALPLFVKRGDLSLKPTFEDNGIKLGHIKISQVDPLRRTIIGIAPFLLGCICIFAIIQLSLSYNLLHSPLAIIIIGYIVFQVGNSMFSSRIDLQQSWKAIIILLIIATLLHLTGFNLDPSITTQLTTLLQKTNLFLLIPITLDLIIVCIISLCTK